MKIPTRCNKRSCQARRNLTKRPELHKQFWPTCHMPGCDGKMYVDEYRLRRGAKDHAPLCRNDCLPYFHRVNTVECRYHSAYVKKLNSAPRSKHCPIAEADRVPF